MRLKPLHDVGEINGRLRDANLDAAVVMSPRNLYLLTGYPRANGQRPGYRRSGCAIAYPDAQPTLVTGRFQEEIALIRGWARDVTTFTDYVESPLARAAEVVERRGLASGRIGIEERWIPLEFYRDFARNLPQAVLVGCDELLAALWASKTPAEISVLTDGQRRLAGAVESALQRASGTEEQIHQSILSAIRKSGTQTGWGHFEAGPRRAYRDLRSGDQPLKHGARLSIEYGCTYEQYSAHYVRTGWVQKAAAEDIENHDRYIRAVGASIGRMRAGQSGAEAFATIKAALESEGLVLCPRTAGHVLGVGPAERPELEPSEQLRLKTGMLVCVDPGTTVGVRFSTTMLISDRGATLIPGNPPSELLVLSGT